MCVCACLCVCVCVSIIPQLELVMVIMGTIGILPLRILLI